MIENINDLLATVRLQNESKRIIDSLRGVKAENEDQDAKNLRDLFFYQRLFDELQAEIDKYRSIPKTIQIEFTEERLKHFIENLSLDIEVAMEQNPKLDSCWYLCDLKQKLEDALNGSKQS